MVGTSDWRILRINFSLFLISGKIRNAYSGYRRCIRRLLALGKSGSTLSWVNLVLLQLEPPVAKARLRLSRLKRLIF